MLQAYFHVHHMSTQVVIPDYSGSVLCCKAKFHIFGGRVHELPTVYQLCARTMPHCQAHCGFMNDQPPPYGRLSDFRSRFLINSLRASVAWSVVPATYG